MNDIDQTALEIARAFIPVDVVGQQRANLQVAIIEAIKKHANPKTLADARPGGRVRLGDQRSDLVPGIVRCAKCTFQLHRTNLYLQSGTVGAGDSKTEPCPNGCGPLWPVTWETWAREGWAEAERLHLEKAALSAQPYPSGQGDAPFTWSDRAKADALEAGQYAFTEADGKDLGYTACIEACVDAICLVLEMPEHRLALAARQPSKQPDSVAQGEATEFCIEKGDRQPVGEPIGWFTDDHLTDRSATTYDRTVADRWRAKGWPVSPLYAAPAQAVDLGTGIKAIASERERQLCIEGFSRDSDEQYREGELARAATAYVQLAAMDLQVGSRKHIASQEPPFFWPWAPEWWKPVDARHDLVRAGALIAAQIDLIDSQAVGK
ncbi:hypothetical protein D7Y22_00935 [Stenotrophomonas maltophilia]|uniref:hypothetical protein n=1 Tax=Stenotrophomonas maltophilia TaxID=40324 RepID=UPI0015E0203B|nr:hypothetical protein [Stenotrophomonas maltophilia]MBA0419527.1 hypothetical protein [Stenotrophomonas maltophilia]